MRHAQIWTSITCALMAMLLGRVYAADWVTEPPLPSAEGAATATVLQNGLVLVAGGYDGNQALGFSALYNPGTGALTATNGALNVPRALQGPVLLANGSELVAGGYASQNGLTTTAEIYDPSTESWTLTGSMSVPRTGFAMALLTNGKVLAAGGQDANGNGLGSSEIYDPATGLWTSGGSMSTTPGSAAFCVLSNGDVLVAGGTDGSNHGGNGSSQSGVDIFDVTSGWTAAASMQYARSGATATLLSNGMVLVAGGRGSQINGSNFSGNNDPLVCELFDPIGGTWSLTGAMASPRNGHFAMLLPGDQVIVGGGNTQSSAQLCEIYDAISGTWSSTVSSPSAVDQSAVAYVPGTGIFSFGGLPQNGNSAVNTILLYDLNATDIAPIADSMTVAVHPNSVGQITLSGSDANGAPLAFIISSPAAHGVVAQLSGANYSYTPNPGFDGVDTFQYLSSDGLMTSSPATVTVVVDAAPIIGSDQIATCQRSGNVSIGPGLLQVLDTDSPPSALVFTLTGGLYHGVLTLSGVPLSFGSTFTQADINNGILVYVNSGTDSEVDGFFFSVTDGSFSLPNNGFQISINHPPVIAINSILKLPKSTSGNILGGGSLTVTDPEQPGTSLTYTVTSLFAASTLKDLGTTLVIGSTFTQSDINQGNITINTSILTGTDTFGFTVTDGQGGSVGPSSFSINVIGSTPLELSTGRIFMQSTPGTVVLTPALLTASSGAVVASSLVYTVTGVTGSIQLSGSPVSSFTQADVNGALVSYVYGGSGSTDTISLAVTDGVHASIAGTIPVAINHAPTITTNSGLTVAPGGSVSLISELQVSDPEQGPGLLTYTIISQPNDGHITVFGFEGNTPFTQANIDAGQVQYLQDGPASASDSFTLSVSDGKGGNLTGLIVAVTIQQQLLLRVNNGLDVLDNNEIQLTSSMLEADEQGVAPSQITYTLVTTLHSGDMQDQAVSGQDLSIGQSFSQDDINNNQVNIGNLSVDDSFTFIVSDGTHALPVATFQVRVHPQTQIFSGQAVVQIGGTLPITTSLLSAYNPELTAVQTVFTLQQAPFYGDLELNGIPLPNSGTFTEDDISNGRLSYVQDHQVFGNGASESINVNVTPGLGTGSNFSNGGSLFILINHPPVLVEDTGAAITALGTLTINPSMLLCDDAEQQANALTYTISATPTHGTLKVQNVPVLLNGTFTQQQIDAGQVSYVNSDGSSDSFGFSVSDGAGGMVGPDVFSITASGALTLANDSATTVNVNQSLTITSSMLKIAETGKTDSSIGFTLTALPTNGNLKDNGSTIIQGGSFTQQDVDNGLVVYTNTSDTELDALQLTASDGVSSIPLILSININHPPTLVHHQFNVALTASAYLSNLNLQATDPEQGDPYLVFTLTTPPTAGTLYLNLISLHTGSTFTQQDIDNGRLSYSQERGSPVSDSFQVSVSDGVGGSTSGTVQITLTSSIMLLTDGPLIVVHGSSFNPGISTQVLYVTSTANQGNNITYTVKAPLPSFGHLQKNGSNLGAGGTFTSQDLNNGQINYLQNIGDGTADAFKFDATDGTNTLTGKIFPIIIRHQLNLDHNAMTVNAGSTTVLTAGMLQIDDAVDGDTLDMLQYTLQNPPRSGQLELDGIPLESGAGFSQDDIVQGHLSYVAANGSANFDNFNFGYGDRYSQNGASMNITINPLPVLALDLGLNIPSGATNAVISTQLLQVTDSFIPDGSLTYTVAGAPAGGLLKLSGATLSHNSTFTQQDVDNNNLTYTDTSGTNSSFTFTVSNGVGGSIGLSAFAITITSKPNPNINFTAITNQVYGVSSFSVSATTNSGDPLTYSVVSGPASLVGTTLTITGAGPVTLAAHDAGNGSFNAGTGLTGFQVNQAVLTVKADSLSRTYGAANPALTYSLVGLVNGDMPGSIGLNGTPTLSCTASSGTPVGPATITVSVGAMNAMNYTIAGANGTLTITPAPLTITANNLSRSYGGSTPAFTAAFAGFVNGEDSSALTGTLAFACSATPTSAPGPYSITPSGLSDANYSISFVAGNLNVHAATLLVTANDATCSQGAVPGSYSFTITGFRNGETAAVLTGSAAAACTASTSSSTGTYPITVSGSLADPDYNIVYVDGTLTIGAVLTVTVQDATKTYGQSNPVFTVTYAGFTGGDTKAQLGGTLAFSTSAVTGSPVGTYSVSASGYTSTKYAIVYVDGSLTVQPAPLTVTANNVNQAYGSPTPALTAFATGLKNGDTLASLGTLVLACSANASSTVGGGPYLIVPEGLSAPNYSITYVNGAVTVIPAVLTVTAANNTMPVGGPVPTPVSTVSYSGFVNGDLAGSALTGAPAVTTTATNASTLGVYPITVALGTLAAVNGDYTFVFSTGATMSVGTPLVVSVQNASCSYGASLPTFTVLYNGSSTQPGGVGGSLAFATSAATGSPIGSYAVTASGLTSAVFAITYQTGNLSITPAPLTVAAQPATSVYGATIASMNATITGFVLSQNQASVLTGSPSLQTTATSASGVGGYPITAGFGSLSLLNGNYQFVFTGSTYTVTAAQLTVTANSPSMVYGAGILPTYTDAITGFVNGDSISVVSGSASNSCPALATSGVGNYTITPSANTLSASNYTFTFVNGTLAITPAVLTVTAHNASMNYGAATLPGFSDSITGFQNGDASTVVSGAALLTTTALASSPVATYPITAAQGTLAAANYSFSFVSGTLTIHKVGLTVTAVSTSMVYGSSSLPVFTDTLTGLVNGDTPATAVSGAASLTTTALASSPVATYPITAAVGTLTSSNYNLSFVNGTLTITKAVLTVTAASPSMAYGAATPALTATITGLVNGDTTAAYSGSPIVTTTAQSGPPSSPAGTYPVTAILGSLTATNYSFSFVAGVLTVNPVALTVTATNKSMVYGAGTLPALTVHYTGLVNGDTPASLTGAPALSTTATVASAVNTYPITVAVGTLVDGNYTFNFTAGTLTVSAAVLTVTGSTDGMITGGTVPTPSFTITGFVNGDTQLSAVTGAPVLTPSATSLSAAGAYPTTVTIGTLTAANYTFTLVNGVINVAAHLLTVSADAQTKLYGAALPALTFTITGFVNGDTQLTATSGTPALTATALASSPVGSYPTSIALGSFLVNSPTTYAVVLSNGSMSVTPAPLTVTANSLSMVQGATVPTLTFAIAGFVNGDSAASLSSPVTISTTATSASAAGTYPITVAGAADANYAITEVPGVMTVTPVSSTGTSTATGTGTAAATTGSGGGGGGGCGLGSGGMGLLGLALLGGIRVLVPGRRRRSA